jgi:AhpD family alkylhydroperoxidase
MDKKFHRRFYAHLGEFSEDFRYMLTHRSLIRRAMRELIPVDFRERLMMIVTEVNGCRYCSYYHAKQALSSGVPAAQLRELLAGSVPQDAPAEELPALLYAQHWADSNAQATPTASQHLREVYGDEKTEAILIILRMIRIGNLLGNTADYWLFALSFGHLGLRPNEARYQKP